MSKDHVGMHENSLQPSLFSLQQSPSRQAYSQHQDLRLSVQICTLPAYLVGSCSAASHAPAQSLNVEASFQFRICAVDCRAERRCRQFRQKDLVRERQKTP